MVNKHDNILACTVNTRNMYIVKFIKKYLNINIIKGGRTLLLNFSYFQDMATNQSYTVIYVCIV